MQTQKENPRTQTKWKGIAFNCCYFMIQQMKSAKIYLLHSGVKPHFVQTVSLWFCPYIPSSQHALELQDTLIIRTCASTNSGSQHSSYIPTYLLYTSVQDKYVLSQIEFLFKHPISNARQSININFIYQVLHSCIPTSKIRNATIVRVPDLRA